ncbi:hypothetical protein ACHAXR_009321 [Thalassiosira sp. AJA248-18]
MSNHHYRAYCNPKETKETSSQFESFPSSSPSQSASLSSSALAAPGRPSSSFWTSSSSSPAVESSSTFSRDDDPSLDLIIQYGRGQCPHSFLPRSLLGASIIQRNDDDDEGSGSVILSIPVEPLPLEGDMCMKSTYELHTSNNNLKNNPIKQILHRVRVQWYRFQPSLSAEMEQADLILCHAGAGTLLEALAISTSTAKEKIINAVINSKLMDNHQSELAEELERRKHIRVTRDCATEWTTKDGAIKFWEEIGECSPVPFSGGRSREDTERQGLKEDSNTNVSSFQKIVDRVMGFHKNGFP